MHSVQRSASPLFLFPQQLFATELCSFLHSEAFLPTWPGDGSFAAELLLHPGVQSAASLSLLYPSALFDSSLFFLTSDHPWGVLPPPPPVAKLSPGFISGLNDITDHDGKWQACRLSA